jgi:hypothetical protein
MDSQPEAFPPLTARAVLLGDRIDQAGLERNDALSTAPLAFRTGDGGMTVVFRYGVVVLIGLDQAAEDGDLFTGDRVDFRSLALALHQLRFGAVRGRLRCKLRLQKDRKKPLA